MNSVPPPSLIRHLSLLVGLSCLGVVLFPDFVCASYFGVSDPSPELRAAVVGLGVANLTLCLMIFVSTPTRCSLRVFAGCLLLYLAMFSCCLLHPEWLFCTRGTAISYLVVDTAMLVLALLASFHPSLAKKGVAQKKDQ